MTNRFPAWHPKKLIFLSHNHSKLNVIQSHPTESAAETGDRHALLTDHTADTELSNIINEYERRLEEQVALAREDVLREIENHIQVSYRCILKNYHHMLESLWN